MTKIKTMHIIRGLIAVFVVSAVLLAPSDSIVGKFFPSTAIEVSAEESGNDGALTVLATNDGETLESGTDYTYTDDSGKRILTILSDKAITIAGNGTATTDRIVVAKDNSANITLSNVNIDVSARTDTAAFLIEDNSEGTVTVTLADGTKNTLISGSNCAGIQKNGDISDVSRIGELIIKGGENKTGVLTAIGGKNGAGIGGGLGKPVSYITIENVVVTAKGGENGDGIGAVGKDVSRTIFKNSSVNAIAGANAKKSAVKFQPILVTMFICLK